MNFRLFAKMLYILYINTKTKSKISLKSHINFTTQLEGYNSVAKDSVLSGANIGYASYVGVNSLLRNSSIGRYCSIGNNVELITDAHPSSSFVSTHPAFFSTRKQSGFSYVNTTIFNEEKTVKNNSDISIIIGNDVWIGNKVILMGGITIGDGAIIAAGSVVTKDVPPYSIIGGSPAKLIRMRFTAEQVSYLVKVKWWDQSSDWLKENANLFTDINRMIELNNIPD